MRTILLPRYRPIGGHLVQLSKLFSAVTSKVITRLTSHGLNTASVDLVNREPLPRTCKRRRSSPPATILSSTESPATAPSSTQSSSELSSRLTNAENTEAMDESSTTSLTEGSTRASMDNKSNPSDARRKPIASVVKLETEDSLLIDFTR